MSAIIVSHREYTYNKIVYIFQDTYTKDDFPFIFRGLFMTDAFSVMSGFFNAYYGYSRVKGSGVAFIFVSMISRWIR